MVPTILLLRFIFDFVWPTTLHASKQRLTIQTATTSGFYVPDPPADKIFVPFRKKILRTRAFGDSSPSNSSFHRRSSSSLVSMVNFTPYSLLMQTLVHRFHSSTQTSKTYILLIKHIDCEKDHWKYIQTGSKNFRRGVADL